MNFMEIEEAILRYLFEYGDTRQSDIITYVESEFGYSTRQIKKIIGRLEKDSKIFRVVHTRLKPPAVYYSLKEHLPLEIQKEMIRAAAKVKKAELDYYAKIQSS